MKYLFVVATLLLSSLSEVNGGAVVLTKDNFKEKMQGKNAFIKFFAPWCGHCKSMKPAWDELGDMYASSSSVLIGDVDCTSSESEAVCEEYGVNGYPTVKFFLDGDDKAKDYEGGRDLDSLKKFTADTLEIKCDPSKPSECSEKEQEYIKKVKDMSSEDRKKQIARLKKMAGDSMKAELKQWLHQRLHILNTL